MKRDDGAASDAAGTWERRPSVTSNEYSSADEEQITARPDPPSPPATSTFPPPRCSRPRLNAPL
ncbi:MAG TPA: hypothetical protein VFV01_46480 [Spirillospora sp.]|nr:hypothetical protein [Spirillospora sp.]